MKKSEKFSSAFASMFFIGLIGAISVFLFLEPNDHFALLIITLVAMLPKVVWELINAFANIDKNVTLTFLRLFFFYGSFVFLVDHIFIVGCRIFLMGIPALLIAVISGFYYFKRKTKNGKK